MNMPTWQIRLGIVLLMIALGFDTLHYLIFKDSDYIIKFVLAQLGFLPISVFLVAVIINQLLGRREKALMLKKLNMVIGSFFSQVGTKLLKSFAEADSNTKQLSPALLFDQTWQDCDYGNAKKNLTAHDYEFSKEAIDWLELRNFLVEEKRFLLSLLGNPNLLEHESFTELIWAVFHLAEELACRKNFIDMPHTDHDHLAGDIKRVYGLLLFEWLAYIRHLQNDYPYLFSLAVRTNPFNPAAHPEIS